MKEDNITYEVVLREERKKEKRKSNLNLIKSLDLSCLLKYHQSHAANRHFKCGLRYASNEGDIDTGFQGLEIQKEPQNKQKPSKISH